MTRGFLLGACAVMTAWMATTGASAQTPDPFVGSWKTNIAKSQYDPVTRRPEFPSTLTRTAAGSGFTVTSRLPDRPPHLEYTFSLDGKDYPLKGTTSADTVAVYRIDAHTQVQVRKKDGVAVSMYRQVVSEDGKTFTSYEIGYKAGSDSYHNVLVFDRQ